MPNFLFNLYRRKKHFPETLKPTWSFSLRAGSLFIFLTIASRHLRLQHMLLNRVAGAVRIELTTFGFGDRRSAN